LIAPNINFEVLQKCKIVCNKNEIEMED
jgi:hypothetical protein